LNTNALAADADELNPHVPLATAKPALIASPYLALAKLKSAG
jgi:hypothetical protein